MLALRYGMPRSWTAGPRGALCQRAYYTTTVMVLSTLQCSQRCDFAFFKVRLSTWTTYVNKNNEPANYTSVYSLRENFGNERQLTNS